MIWFAFARPLSQQAVIALGAKLSGTLQKMSLFKVVAAFTMSLLLSGCTLGGIIQDGPPVRETLTGRSAYQWLDSRSDMNGAGWIGRVSGLNSRPDGFATLSVDSSVLTVTWREDQHPAFPSMQLRFGSLQGEDTFQIRRILIWNDRWTMNATMPDGAELELTVSEHNRDLMLHLTRPGSEPFQLNLRRPNCGAFLPRNCFE